MQEQGQDEERGVDGREVAGEPWRQVDIGNRTVLGAKRLGNIGERAAESIGRKDQALPGDHGARDCRAAVSPPREPRIQHVGHAGLDGEPGQCVHSLDRHQRGPGGCASPFIR